jgi:WhiB family transcriptional regulator, redox-sensing transcriptional regulator
MEHVFAAAVCRIPGSVLTRLFFSDDPDEIQAAKQLCAGCRLRVDCLAGALARAEPAGVWGGEELRNGRIVRLHRRRGRPGRVLAPTG